MGRRLLLPVRVPVRRVHASGGRGRRDDYHGGDNISSSSRRRRVYLSRRTRAGRLPRLVQALPRLPGQYRLRLRYHRQRAEHRRTDSSQHDLGDELHPDRAGSVGRPDDGRLPAVRSVVLRASRHRRDANAQLFAGRAIHAVFRLLQRGRSHRFHLAHRRSRCLQVGYYWTHVHTKVKKVKTQVFKNV